MSHNICSCYYKWSRLVIPAPSGSDTATVWVTVYSASSCFDWQSSKKLYQSWLTGMLCGFQISSVWVKGKFRHILLHRVSWWFLQKCWSAEEILCSCICIIQHPCPQSASVWISWFSGHSIRDQGTERSQYWNSNMFKIESSHWPRLIMVQIKKWRIYTVYRT